MSNANGEIFSGFGIRIPLGVISLDYTENELKRVPKCPKSLWSAHLLAAHALIVIIVSCVSNKQKQIIGQLNAR